MLTFAPPSENPSLTAWMGALAAPVAAWFTPGTATVVPAAPATHSDAQATGAPECWKAVPGAGPVGAHSSYWPCERLNAFILQMAAQGHCVNAAMMLGHRPYAEEQLAKALAVPDDGLRALAAELRTYFEAPPEGAVLQLNVNGDPAPADQDAVGVAALGA